MNPIWNQKQKDWSRFHYEVCNQLKGRYQVWDRIQEKFIESHGEEDWNNFCNQIYEEIWDLRDFVELRVREVKGPILGQIWETIPFIRVRAPHE